jgi:glycosyltransferase involved in cell wall biosynthesis
MTDKKRKLIFFWPYLEWGGAQIYILAIIKEAIAGWDVTVILPRESSPEIKRFIDQTGSETEFLDFYLDMSPARSISQKLRRQFRRIKVEIASFRYLLRFKLSESILHIDFPPWQSWIFFTALLLRRANVFVTLHNAIAQSPAWRVMIWKLRLQFVSRLPGFNILTSNQDTKDRLRGWVSEKFWQNIKVTYTCVNPLEIQNVLAESEDAVEIRKTHNIGNDKFVVLCVGQFIDRKGRWVFLDAAKIVSESSHDVQFVWLTPKKPTEIELKKIKSYNLENQFQLILSEKVGASHQDVLSFFRIADVFALPSFVEGLPIALLEAMAMGVPSISTRVYAIPEAIFDRETGILIEPGDAEQLAAAILELKNNNDLRNVIANKGQKIVLENFDERVASQIAISAYKECFSDEN